MLLDETNENKLVFLNQVPVQETNYKEKFCDSGRYINLLEELVHNPKSLCLSVAIQ